MTKIFKPCIAQKRRLAIVVILFGMGSSPAAMAVTGVGDLGAAVNFGSLPLVGAAPTGVENMFGSCVNATQYSSSGTNFNSSAWKTLLNNVAGSSSATSGLISINGLSSGYDPGPMCSGNDTVEASDLTCESDPSEYAARRESAARALAVIECKEKKIQMVPGQLTCLSQQASKFEDLIRNLKNLLAEKFSEAHSKVAEITSVIQDRETQIKEVQSRLEGGKGGNPPGLLAIEREMQAAVDNYFGSGEGAQGSSGAIEDLRQGQKKVAEERSRLAQYLIEKKTGYTSECFNSRSKSTYQCVRGGPVVSPKEYLLCRFEQNQSLGNDGTTVESDKLTKRVAGEKRLGLEQILNEMFAYTPSSGSGATATSTSTSTEYNLSRLMSKYGSLLSGYNGKGIDVSSFVMTHVSQCIKWAEKEVDRERRNQNSELAQREAGIKTQEETNNSKVRAMLQKGAQLYSKAMTGLSGTGQLPFSVEQCNGAKPAVQLSCVENMGNTIKGLLDGTSQNSTMNMTVRGKDSQGRTNIQFTCNGVRQCKDTYNTLSMNLGAEIDRVKGVRKQYVANFNASADKLISDVSTALSPAADALKKQIQMMNSQLAILGATINIPDLDGKGAKLEPDSNDDMDGMYKMPQNVKDLVAASTDPKMPDLAGNNFTTALESIAKVSSDLGSKRGKISEVWASLSGKLRSCEKQARKEEGEALAKRADQLQSMLPYCNDNFQRALAQNAIDSANSTAERLKSGRSSGSFSTSAALGGAGRQPASSSSTGEQSHGVDCTAQIGSLNRATSSAGTSSYGGGASGAASAIGGAVQGLVDRML